MNEFVLSEDEGDVLVGKPPGRRDAKGNEAAIETKFVKAALAELLVLYERKTDASEAFAAGVKATAERSGMLSVSVRRYVVARAKDKMSEVHREYEQLALLFLDVGGL